MTLGFHLFLFNQGACTQALRLALVMRPPKIFILLVDGEDWKTHVSALSGP